MRVLSFLLASVLAVTHVAAQVVSTPFVFDGPLDSVSATTTKFNSGGNITIWGVAITVPENLQVQFPAAFVPFQKFAADYALNTAFYAGFEFSIDGNYVNGVPIAGRVFISQLIAGAGAGLVQSVANDGTLKIQGGPTLRINTPNGVYAVAYTQKPFFTADEQNPSISSFSGYPMCIPRSAADPDCPANNRVAARVYRPNDVNKMAPFIAGDYVTWAGIKNGANEVLVYTLVAENVQQQFTASETVPMYVRVEDVVIAVNDGSTNVEVGTNRFTGYLSDPAGSVSVYRVDVDPCTGAETEVQIAAGTTKAGDVRNKFDIRFRDLVTISNISAQYRVKANTGSVPVAFGIQAGQFTAPISELIWPEVNVPGTVFPQNPFQLFNNLKDGFADNGTQYGQLKPWPGTPVPTPMKTCGPLPIANAGPDILHQNFGAITTLTGSQTNPAFTDADVTFTWSGPAGAGQPVPAPANTKVTSFTNPWAGLPSITRTFTLKVCLVANPTACSTDTVDVTTDNQVETITITSYRYANRNIALTAITNNVLPSNPNGAQLRFFVNGATTGGTLMTQSTTNRAQYTINFTRNTAPNSIRITSQHGGVATAFSFI